MTYLLWGSQSKRNALESLNSCLSIQEISPHACHFSSSSICFLSLFQTLNLSLMAWSRAVNGSMTPPFTTTAEPFVKLPQQLSHSVSSPTIITAAALTAVNLSQPGNRFLVNLFFSFLYCWNIFHRRPLDMLVEGLTLLKLVQRCWHLLYLFFWDKSVLQNTTELLEERSLWFQLLENHFVPCRDRKVQAPICSVFSGLWFSSPH